MTGTGLDKPGHDDVGHETSQVGVIRTPDGGPCAWPWLICAPARNPLESLRIWPYETGAPISWCGILPCNHKPDYVMTPRRARPTSPVSF
jgi:hypothetical protein